MSVKYYLSVLGFAAAAAMAVPSVASASLLANESFDYTVGGLAGNSGGTGWTGAWGAPGSVTRADVVDTTGNPLTFTPAGGAPIDGGTRALEVAVTATGQNQLCGARTLASPIAETFYVGYLVRYVGAGAWDSSDTFALHLGTNATSTTTLNFGPRAGTAGGPFMIRFGTGVPVSGASTDGILTSNTTYFLVARVNWDGSAFTSANLWLNPAANDDVNIPSGHASLSGFSSGPITHLFFRHALLDLDDIVQADEIRIGTLWGDVVPVPEPGSMALLLLGAVGISAMQWRKFAVRT